MIELIRTRGRGRGKVVDAVVIDDQRPEYGFSYVQLVTRTVRRGNTARRSMAVEPSHHTYPFWRIVLAGSDGHALIGSVPMPFPTHEGHDEFLHPWEFVPPTANLGSQWVPASSCRLDPNADRLSCTPPTAELSDYVLLEALFQRARQHRAAGGR